MLNNIRYNNCNKQLKDKNFKRKKFSLFNNNSVTLYFISISFILLFSAAYVDLFKIPSTKEITNKLSINVIQSISANPEKTKRLIEKDKTDLTTKYLSQLNYYELIDLSLNNSIESKNIDPAFFYLKYIKLMS